MYGTRVRVTHNRVECEVVHLLPLSLQARHHLGANFLRDIIIRPVGA
jgi:hypothetical protein